MASLSEAFVLDLIQSDSQHCYFGGSDGVAGRAPIEEYSMGPYIHSASPTVKKLISEHWMSSCPLPLAPNDAGRRIECVNPLLLSSCNERKD